MMNMENILSVDNSSGVLPTISTDRSEAEVFGSLLKMSKQGKLAGYGYADGDDSAVADAHGMPFDSDLVIKVADEKVRFSLKMRPKIPAIFAVLLIVTVWPGLPLTDSFMYSFVWYERLMGESIETWMWYLPLTVLPIPFVWKSAMKKSRASAHEHALETIEKIRAVL